MNTKRLLAVPAIAAVSLLALTGCFQAPSIPGTDEGTETQAPATGTETQAPAGGDAGASSDLAGTSWTGSIDNFADMTFVLNADGTIDFSNWNDESVDFDFDADVWTGDASNLTITITDLENEFDLTATGTVTGGSMNLSGTGTDGNSYTITASQG